MPQGQSLRQPGVVWKIQAAPDSEGSCFTKESDNFHFSSWETAPDNQATSKISPASQLQRNYNSRIKKIENKLSVTEINNI